MESQEDSFSDDIIAFFMSMSIFDRINAEEIKVIARHMSKVALNQDDILFRETEKGSYVCFIREGELDVIKRSEETGKDVVLTTLKQGHSIGEMSVVDDFPRSATIRARCPATLYILSKSAFDLILDKHPKIGIKLLKGISCLLSSNLRDTSNRLADYILPLT